MKLFRRFAPRDKRTSQEAETPPQGQQPTPSEPRPWESERVGLYVLRNPSEADIDIVFVHGFLGDLETTWRSSKKIFWPGDENFWTDSMSRARVFTFGYDTALFGGSYADIFDAWNSLLSALYMERRRLSESRPIMFIAHSLGGILVKQALNSASQNETYQSIAADTKAIFFFGTPHRGADIALWVERIVKVVDVATIGFSGRDPFITGLKRNAPLLTQITSDFAGKISGIQIRTLYETEPTKGIKVDTPNGSPNFSDYEQIVEKDSCVLVGGGNERLIPMQGADHSSICKFDSAQQQRFRLVKDAMDELIEALYQSDMPRLHDNWKVQQGLDYRTRLNRYKAVTERHGTTLDWIFDPGSEQTEVSELFQNWLRKGKGCFWISGKAGSGKSTLMKYIYKDPRTMNLLSTTAKGAPCLILPFFFWIHGANDIEKDRSGMLRSLLLEAISLLPALRITIFPQLEEFDKARKHGQTLHLQSLIDGFRRLLHQRHVPCRILFLIDGLDEFSEPDPAISLSALTDLLLEVSGTKNCQLLVSGRPWALLENVFKRFPCLCLQDHTSDDISRYVFDRIHNNPRAQHLQSDKQNVVDEIVNVANGVFLWVRVVVESVVEGFLLFDNLEELRARLRELPQELDDLYSHIFGRIPSRYKEQAFRVLQTYLIHTLITAHPVDKDWDALRITESEPQADVLLAADLHVAMQMSLPRRLDIEEFFHVFDMRLRARCFGILEVQRIQTQSSHTMLSTASLQTVAVVLIHRSALEFLCRQDTQGEMDALLSPSGFDPVCSLFASCWKQIVWNREQSRELVEGVGSRSKHYDIPREAKRAFQIARSLRDHRNTPMVSILDAIDSEVALYASGFQSADKSLHWSNTLPIWCNENGDIDDLLSLAIRRGIMFYVRSKVQTRDDLALRLDYQKLLTMACFLYQEGEDSWLSPLNIDMVEFLLKVGLDPNGQYQGLSCWERLLQTRKISISAEFVEMLKSATLPNIRAQLEALAVVRILIAFLKHGADPCLIKLQDLKSWNDNVKNTNRFISLAIRLMGVLTPDLTGPFFRLVAAAQGGDRKQTEQLLEEVEKHLSSRLSALREKLKLANFKHDSDAVVPQKLLDRIRLSI